MIKNQKKFVIGLFLVVLGLICPVSCTVKSIQFNQNCGGFIKQASDANTPELALERINLALDYIKAHGITNGYTSILIKTEAENVGFWYRNIVACQEELNSCLSSSQLEKTNVLMKVRESLSQTPDGISLYPYNRFWALINTISLFMILAGLKKVLNELEWNKPWVFPRL